MNHTPIPPDPYTRAMWLRRDLFNAVAADNNPGLLYPDLPEGTPLPETPSREEEIELAYYRHLDAHRAELGDHPDFARAYSIIDDLTADGLDITDLHTEPDDPPQRHDHDWPDPAHRDRPSRNRSR
ncbi:hypothetical protein [Nocardia bovistercoris]|uniref:Uncharacterized protein n=1 Tax=Nocardia bovistercoris TaxID=2785916 RepID=A0A931N0J2_9NOCA|nr:hypothetical protein [Nocardia bovistercoris]MBH0775054.1 hypothetical protein [Nocardia bovistercoris]